MKIQWIGKKVDLLLLVNSIENFFAEKGFKITKEQKSSVDELFAVLSLAKDSLAMKVKVSGSPNNFTVEFIKGMYERGIKAGLVTLPFGGGNLILLGLRFQQKLKRLEDEFWICIEKTVSDLVGSLHS